MKVKTGVIGVGAIGRHHARIYSGMENAELVGVADVDVEKAKEVASLYRTKYFTDYLELLENVDAVSIATPTTLHAEVAIEAIKNNVHVLIEKPIADSLTNADRIIRSARKNKIKLMIGHIERFNPVVVKLKELIESGELGDVLTISAERVGPYSPRIRDVGIIIDLAVHDIDTMSYLYDERGSEVYAIAGNSFHKSEDYASILIRFGKNRAGMVNTNWLTPKKIRILTAVGTQGVASLNYLDQTLELWKKEKVKRIEVRKREPLKNELDSFINCIIEDKNPHPSGEDGKYVLSVAIAAIRSYKECRAIDLTGFY